MFFNQHPQPTPGPTSPQHLLSLPDLFHIDKSRVNNCFSQTETKSFFAYQLISIRTIVEKDLSS